MNILCIDIYLCCDAHTKLGMHAYVKSKKKHNLCNCWCFTLAPSHREDLANFCCLGFSAIFIVLTQSNKLKLIKIKTDYAKTSIITYSLFCPREIQSVREIIKVNLLSSFHRFTLG